MTFARRRSSSTVGDDARDGLESQPLLQILSSVDAFVGPTGSFAPTPGEPRYRQFLDALGVAVYTTDQNGGITFYNEAAAEFWGRRPALGEEWCGSYRLYWPDGRPMPKDECPMAIALHERRPIRGYQGICERPDASRVSFVPYPTPLHDADGTLVGAVNVVVDVTERVQAEASLRASAEALTASNAVKDEFLGLVSHELRTPVTTIFGNARLLTDPHRQLAETARQGMLEDVAVDAERLLVVVENLLLLTRLGAGSDIELEPHVLAHLVRTTVDAFARRHRDRKIEVTIERRHLVVEADRTYVTLLLENLLSNADKYSPTGSPIDVAVTHGDGEARVIVLDRGIGIDDDDTERIFSAFYRSEAAKARANGLGIGLAVCKRLVDVQGGRIWARRREGGGSEFGFSLQLSPEG
jgi:PAS domain S-box-containing protein